MPKFNVFGESEWPEMDAMKFMIFSEKEFVDAEAARRAAYLIYNDKNFAVSVVPCVSQPSQYTAETYSVVNSSKDDGEMGWRVKDGDNTILDIPYRSSLAEQQAKRIAFLLNTFGMVGGECSCGNNVVKEHTMFCKLFVNKD